MTIVPRVNIGLAGHGRDGYETQGMWTSWGSPREVATDEEALRFIGAQDANGRLITSVYELGAPPHNPGYAGVNPRRIG